MINMMQRVEHLLMKILLLDLTMLGRLRSTSSLDG